MGFDGAYGYRLLHPMNSPCRVVSYFNDIPAHDDRVRNGVLVCSRDDRVQQDKV
jgi:hypothetical protein